MSKLKEELRQEYGDTDPNVILKQLPSSLLNKKLREYFEDVALDFDPPTTSKSITKSSKQLLDETEFPSQSSPLNEVKGKKKKDKKLLPSSSQQQQSLQDNDVIPQVIQSQPSPDSTSSKLIDYKIQFKLKEFHIPCDPLSRELHTLATSGFLDWKTYFKSNGTILQINPNAKKKVASSSNKRSHKKSDNNYIDVDLDDINSTSHGSSSDSDYSDDDDDDKRKKKKKSKKKKKEKSRKRVETVEEKEELPSFKCTICKVKFRVQKSLDKHYNSAHKAVGDPIQCNQCPVISTNPLDAEIHVYEVHEGPNILDWNHKITCKSCPGQMFTTYVDFNNHIVNHVEVKDIGYGCTICGWSSDKYNNVQVHSRSHIQFKCTFCDKKYNKLKLVENHCNINHKTFGRPFSCSLCDYRSSIYSLLEEHRETRHAIKVKGIKNGMNVSSCDNKEEVCLLCGDTNSFLFTSRKVILDHLSQHTKIHLYKCIECDYTGDNSQVFDDHFIETHISKMIETNVYFEETNIDKIMDKIAILVKKKVSNGKSSRNRPNLFETQSAVAAILDDSANENSSYGGDQYDRYFDFVSNEEENVSKKKKGRKSSEVEVDTIDTSTYTGRPKRKSFIDAQVKLSASATVDKKTTSKDDDDTDNDDDDDFVEVNNEKSKVSNFEIKLSKRKKVEVIEQSIPMTETNSALDTLNHDLNYIPEEITSPSQNQQINTQLIQLYQQQTIAQGIATGEDDDEDIDDDFDPDLQFNSLGQVVNQVTPGQNVNYVNYSQNDPTMAATTSATTSSLTPFGPTGCVQEEPPATYYDADSKMLVINGVPVYDSQGNVAQVEPHEVDQVFELYTSQSQVVGGGDGSGQYTGY